MQEKWKVEKCFTQKRDDHSTQSILWHNIHIKLLCSFLWFGVLVLPQLANATLLLSEVFYDAVGSDDGLSFVEIFGDPGMSLSGVQVVGINGADGRETHVLNLASVIPDDGFFVLADRLTGGGTLVSNADLVLNFDLQNGPDSVILRAGGNTLDAVGYGEFLPGDFFFGEGQSVPSSAAGFSASRRFANVDTDDNSADFVVIAPTPGSGPLAAVPEPGTASLVLLGLASLHALGRKQHLRV